MRYYVVGKPEGGHIYNIPFVYMWIGGDSDKYIVLELNPNKAIGFDDEYGAIVEAEKILEIMSSQNKTIGRGVYILTTTEDNTVLDLEEFTKD